MSPAKGGAGLADVAAYYAACLAEHGQTARGVDWNGENGQELRFAQLCKVLDPAGGFSVNDLGCGYGALYDYLSGPYPGVRYHGVDISPEMVAAARARLGSAPAVRFSIASAPTGPADYGVASGIFNVRLNAGAAEWSDYIGATLDALDATSTRGFAFNCLTSWSDADRMRDTLHYADPCELFAHCKRRYSRNVALLHDYGLYEFTILVRKGA